MKKNVKKRSSHKAVVRITFTAMMVALYFVLDRFLAFFPTDSVKISFSFIAVAVCAIWLGPVEGMLAGGLGDFVSAVLMPVGALNPMLTATSALSGLLFGIACKRRVDAPLSHFYTALRQSGPTFLHHSPYAQLKRGSCYLFA